MKDLYDAPVARRPGPHDTPERTAFRDAIRRFVQAELAPHAADWDEAGEVPWDVHARLGALGVWGFGIDEALGGLGFDDCHMRVAYCEEVAMCGATGVQAALNGRQISVEPIARLASSDLARRVLPEVLSGREGSSLAITEPSGGSDVAALRTTARRDGNHWVLNGRKTFITGGLRSSWFVVGARTGGAGLAGISLFLVPADAPGFSRASVGPKQGWWASDTATLTFDDCRVPAENLMGDEDRGFLAIMENFNLERLGLACSCLGMMRVCLADAVDWAGQRETFGRPLIARQAIRHKIADMSARIDALEAWIDRLAWEVNEGPMPVAGIAKCKVFASKSLEFCASEAMQVLGGAGYLRGGRVERIWREVKVFAIGGGSEEIMRDLAVRQMGL
ncbi:MAG: acyl-CoA dehydrogenase family protein [Pseudomonadota bacterium]